MAHAVWLVEKSTVSIRSPAGSYMSWSRVGAGMSLGKLEFRSEMSSAMYMPWGMLSPMNESWDWSQWKPNSDLTDSETGLGSCL